VLVPALAFAAALALLLVAARFFTGAAERIGLALGMSPFVVGVFIVAIGTSLPELVASVLSVRAGASEIVSGNVLGANAANLLMILGAVSVAVPGGRILLGEQYLFIDLHFLLGATLALGTAMADGRVTPVEGALLLVGYGVYVAYLLAEGRTATADAAQAESLPGRSRAMARDAAVLVASGAAVALVSPVVDVTDGVVIRPCSGTRPYSWVLAHRPAQLSPTVVRTVRDLVRWGYRHRAESNAELVRTLPPDLLAVQFPAPLEPAAP